MFKLLGGISFTEMTKWMQTHCPQQCINLTLAHVPYFATFASGWYDPSGDRPLIVVDLRGKKTVDASRRDLANAHIVF